MDNNQVGISVQNLSIRFRHQIGAPSLRETVHRFINRKQAASQDFIAVKNISLEVKDGERVAIVGHNGAGKSTMLKCLAGIYPPSTGMVRIHGVLIPLLELGAGFSMSLSARDNIYLNGAILGLDRKKIQEIEEEILEFAELKDFSNQPMITLSLGMRSRLGFSVASFLSPEILLLDEVFATGDIVFVQKAKARMLEMIDDCRILMMVSHQEEILREVCNRIIVMHHGEIVMDGSVDEGLKFYHELLHIGN
ncbi:MAG: ATP-binding cassette domain-containing protein [Mariprofundaceae bacterium]|nr:ATP-binding cassette domain-containing protein [Mariprofundaceae bacterium]